MDFKKVSDFPWILSRFFNNKLDVTMIDGETVSILNHVENHVPI